MRRALKKMTFVIFIFLALATFLITQSDVVLFLPIADADRLVQRGNYYFNVGGSGKYDLEKAERYFDRALEVDPLALDAWHQLSRIDFLRGDFDGALEKINRQITLHGDSLMSSYYIRGLIYGYTKKFAEAEEDFLKFYRWDPKNWAIYTDLAWVYFQEEKYEKALQTAFGGLAWNPNNPWLLNMVGVSLMNLGRKEEAKIYLEKALFWAETLTEGQWQKAYPGNNPRAASRGVEEMRKAIRNNLAILGQK